MQSKTLYINQSSLKLVFILFVTSGRADSSLRLGLFPGCGRWGPLSCCGARGLGLQQLRLVGLSSCGSQAELPHGMWDLPDQGSHPCLLRWQADSLPLSHRGSPHLLKVHVADKETGKRKQIKNRGNKETRKLNSRLKPNMSIIRLNLNSVVHRLKEADHVGKIAQVCAVSWKLRHAKGRAESLGAEERPHPALVRVQKHTGGLTCCGKQAVSSARRSSCARRSCSWAVTPEKRYLPSTPSPAGSCL